jgi:drug/metabolite transporter (DMT)-like permease
MLVKSCIGFILQLLSGLVLAGCGFGGFFILISRVHPVSTFWSLAATRFLSVGVLLPLVRLQRKPLVPRMAVAPLVVLAEVLDAIGNAFFVLAAHNGRLDVAAILSSLYPAVTVGLSVLVLRERVIRIQAIGILLVLLAVPLISA